jgi:Ferric reductase like transmembrane component
LIKPLRWRRDPIAQALNQFGLVGLIFLVAALACTPIKTTVGQTWQMRIRRMLGLFAFFYAVLHVITYAAIDQGLDWHAIAEDVIKRKFIFFGFSTFVLLVPLAVNLDQRGGQETWLRALETASSPRLCSAGIGRAAFHLEGQTRRARANNLRTRASGATGRARLEPLVRPPR